MTTYDCPFCGTALKDQGLFGQRVRFRRFTCENTECDERGTSWPEETLQRRLRRTAWNPATLREETV